MARPDIYLFTVLVGSLSLSSCYSHQSFTPSPIPLEQIKIGGSAETYDILEELIDVYSTQTQDIEFQFLPPGKTQQGIEGVKTQVIDMGGVSRNISAEEAGNKTVYIPLTSTSLVLISHDSVTGVLDLNREQIQSIYSGKISNWQDLGGPDAAIVLFDLTEDENEKKLLRDVYLGVDLAITADAIVFSEEDELLEIAAITPFSLAAVPYEDELEDLPINILSIDGLAPTPDNLQSGRYPMVLPLGIMVSTTPSTATQDFIDFITSSEGQEILLDDDED